MEAAIPSRPERTTPLRAHPGERMLAGAIALGSLTVLTIAAWLNPSERGHGTHTQIGLPPCSWAIWFDKPCLTCGMTTAFSYSGEGRWITAFLTQPAGAILSLMTATAFWLAAHVALTGSRLSPMTAWLIRPRTVAILIGGLLLAWVYKILSWNPV
ncbi:MAG: DUF2752 domain-containing protein [Phycisphaerales bacterium]|nr:DUF2752 domain-containing protein [Planctomycetota bacterium]MCH8507889.1 DUF2752 domain-containing protein [Phycisphaerales bacterium]